jgi:hypothetical protein
MWTLVLFTMLANIGAGGGVTTNVAYLDFNSEGSWALLPPRNWQYKVSTTYHTSSMNGLARRRTVIRPHFIGQKISLDVIRVSVVWVERNLRYDFSELGPYASWRIRERGSRR